MTAAVPKFSEVKVGDPIKPIVLPPISELAPSLLRLDR